MVGDGRSWARVPKFASTAAGKIPLMPPPSMERIRKSPISRRIPAGHGGPELIQQSGGARAVRGTLGIPPFMGGMAAGPNAGQKPGFEPEHPRGRPGMIVSAIEFVARQSSSHGIVETEAEAQPVVVDVNVRRSVACAPRIEPNDRRDDAHANAGRLPCAGVKTKVGKIQDADPVGARIRRQVTFPAPNDPRVEKTSRNDGKSRKINADCEATDQTPTYGSPKNL